MKTIVKTEVTFKAGRINRFFEIDTDKKLADELHFKPAALKQFVCFYSILSVSLASRKGATRFTDVLSRIFLAPYALETTEQSIEYAFNEDALWDNYRANRQYNADQTMNPLAKRFIKDAIRFGVSKMQAPKPEEDPYLWDAPEYHGRDRLQLLKQIIGIRPLAGPLFQPTGVAQDQAVPNVVRTQKEAVEIKKKQEQTPTLPTARATARSDARAYPKRSEMRSRTRGDKRKRTNEPVIDRSDKPDASAEAGAAVSFEQNVKRFKAKKNEEHQKRDALGSHRDRGSLTSLTYFFKENKVPKKQRSSIASSAPKKK